MRREDPEPSGVGGPKRRRRASARQGGFSPPYEEWTKDELLVHAAELGIEGRSRLTRTELIRTLRRL